MPVSEMQAVILAAGMSARLNAARPMPKCLTPVLGRPLIEWIMKGLTDAGIKRIHLIVGWNAQQIEDFVVALGTGAEVSTSRCHDWQDGNGRSAAHARSVVGDSQRFVLTMSDHLITPSHIAAVIAGGQMAGDSCVLATSVPGLDTDTDDATKVMAGPDGRVLEIGKTLSRYNAIDTGVFSMTPRLFDALDLAAAGGDASLTGGNRQLASARHLIAHSIGSLPWQDVDTAEDLIAAEHLAGNVFEAQ